MAKYIKPERIDWSKERTVDSNFCGYCDNTPTGGSCDGTCFTRVDYNNSYKKQHLENELELIYENRKRLEDRKKLLEEELRILNNQ